MPARDGSPLIGLQSIASQERRWIEMHELVVRGIFHPGSLSAGEVSVISSIALLALADAGKGIDPADPQPDQQTH